MQNRKRWIYANTYSIKLLMHSTNQWQNWQRMAFAKNQRHLYLMTSESVEADTRLDFTFVVDIANEWKRSLIIIIMDSRVIANSKHILLIVTQISWDPLVIVNLENVFVSQSTDLADNALTRIRINQNKWHFEYYIILMTVPKNLQNIDESRLLCSKGLVSEWDSKTIANHVFSKRLCRSLWTEFSS